jgi:N-formylglutamate amidohydrolase
MTSDAYRLTLPDIRRSSVVFASPHSGNDYSPGFLARSVLDEQTIRSSEDAFVDQLFDVAPLAGSPLLAALAPRAFIDMNRSADELDPALIEGVGRNSHNPRISSGLGVIPRVVAGGRAIYRGKLPMAEAEHRITAYWKPYHNALQRLLNDQLHLFGEAILIDCHSMPHEAIEGFGARNRPRPQVVLGDRFGASASARIVDRVEAAFANAGMVVARNAPFAGAFIAQQYGRPSRGQHVIQIEIDRSMYMDEALVRPNWQFAAVKRQLSQVVAELVAIGRRDLPLAAE